MTQKEMIDYVEEKGYAVKYGTYSYNKNVPYIEINGITVFIAKSNAGGLSTTPDYPKTRFAALEYFCKAYNDRELSAHPLVGKNFLDFSKLDYDNIVMINNSTYPYFAEEVKLWERLDNFGIDGDDLSDSDREKFWELRKSIIEKNGIKYKKL